MANKSIDEVVRNRLSRIHSELVAQVNVASYYPDDGLSFEDEMKQIAEFIAVGEYGIVYESLVVNLEQIPFILSGNSAIALLEAIR